MGSVEIFVNESTVQPANFTPYSKPALGFEGREEGEATV